MQKIWQEAEALQPELVERRRDLHRHPETGWTEFRTASIVIKELQALGYEVYMGDDALVEEEMMGLPVTEVLEQAMVRAVSEGADADLVEKMRGGKTGVVGVMKFSRPGKIVAFRFDMDCNDVEECDTADHRPLESGFQSLHAKEMHACGHDGHVTIGLGLAKLISEYKEEMAGTIKLIFQPAEEGVRGARAMVAKGIVDDVDYMFGGHIGFKATKSDSLVCLTGGFLATTKLDASFKGESSHAGAAPERGRNALLAAAASCIALHSISRHGQGASRINVGVLQAGTGRNVLPDVGLIKMETRGANTEINEFMVTEARRMIKASADMYNVDVTVSEAGGAPACVADHELGAEIKALAEACGQYGQVVDYMDLGGSEDCSYFMERVQQNGGRAAYLMYGTEIAAGHHNSCFDFDEKCLYKAVAMLTELAIAYTNK